MMRGESLAPAISFAVGHERFPGLGRLVMTIGAAAATALAPATISTPALANSLRFRRVDVEEPITRHPAASRLRRTSRP